MGEGSIVPVGLVVPFFEEDGTLTAAVVSAITNDKTTWLFVCPEYPPREIVLDELPARMLEKVLEAKREYEKQKDAVAEKLNAYMKSLEDGDDDTTEEFEIPD